MRLSHKWLMFFASAGFAAQYFWLQSIPSMSAQAVGVAAATVMCSVLTALLFERSRGSKKHASWLVLLVCIFVGTLAASISYWALVIANAPEAVNSLSRYKASAIVMTSLVGAGWGVGFLCGFASWLSIRQK